ncbi:MAG: hypothetical protein N2C12_00055, partial [Planctomycetales bacterium]
MSSPVESAAESLTTPTRKLGWRRLLRFRLLSLLVLVTVVAVWLGWWSHKARQQREAVAAINKVGGQVAYDFQREGLETPRHWPEWLVDWLGVDYFSNVTSLHLGNAQITDEGLKHLEGLQALKGLSLNNTQVTDKGLKHLDGLQTLKWLRLGSTRVTDAGMKHLEGLQTLDRLYLDHAQVTDAGLKHLEGLTTLGELYINHTLITDAGLEHLKG